MRGGCVCVMPPSQYGALDSTLLVPNKRASGTLEPGSTKYFHIDVPVRPPSAERPSLTLRLHRTGGDPVLMASMGQWPVVDLDAAEDMVRAHFCAFDSFHADAESHVLTIPDCSTQYYSIGYLLTGLGAANRYASSGDPCGVRLCLCNSCFC